MADDRPTSQVGDRRGIDAINEVQQPLRPAMVMAIRGDGDGKRIEGGMSPKGGPSKGTWVVCR
jgi:hypothetical protein